MSGVNTLSYVEQYIDSHAAIITLNKSKEGNLLNNKSMEALFKAFTSAVSNTDVRVIILRSNGSNFCLGMDLVMLQSIEGDKKTAKDTIFLYVKLLSFIHASCKPVLCLINGAVKAGGVGLVGACDIVIASEISTFELSEVFFGLIPANVLPFIYSFKMSPQNVKYLMLTAKKISAKESHRLNLVDEVFKEEDMEKGIKSVIKNLFRASPDALASAKQFTHSLFGEKMENSTVMAKEILLDMIQDPKVKKAIKDFNEGNIPQWFDKFRPEKSLVI